MLKQLTLLAFIALVVFPVHTKGFTSMTTKSNKKLFSRSSFLYSKKEDNDGSSSSSEEGFEVKTRNPLRLAVLRLGLTEPAWTSPLNYGKKDGIFKCAYCGNTLFDSDSKYDSGSGWPSFWRSKDDGSMDYKMEFDGRLECRCGTCKSHLGHVFLDGPRPDDVSQELLQESPEKDPRSRRADGRLPRFCVNGACLSLEERSK